jgi:hypothetical protein
LPRVIRDDGARGRRARDRAAGGIAPWIAARVIGSINRGLRHAARTAGLATAAIGYVARCRSSHTSPPSPCLDFATMTTVTFRLSGPAGASMLLDELGFDAGE